ncbi:hypothetical protein A2U01_0028526 [Trifolium medium]|uniref:Uncharacterized protein n=1 Tax=Trifolium medium TaxID=97028 RepID=A0A392P611_9FABA|nr:hypothetical protein [Trifolium medium]
MCSVRTEASGSKEGGRSMLGFIDDKYPGELFEKLGLKKEDICPYEGTDLQGFNGSTICPWGLINLPVTFESKGIKHMRKTTEVQFLVIPCESPYNCILERLSLAALGAVPSTVHLKIKYHGDKGGVVTIEEDMIGAKKWHKSTHKAPKIPQKPQNEPNSP